MALHDLAWYVNFGDGSTTGYYAVPVWTALSAYTAGQIVRQAAAPAVGSERLFVCIIAGTSLASEPAWVVTRGAKTAEAAGPTWQEITGFPGINTDLTNSPAWLPYKNANVTLGACIYDSATASLQICSTSGTAGNGSTPSFSTTAGTTTADNTATWTSLGLASSFSTKWKYPHARTANAMASTWGVAGTTPIWVANTSAETQASAVNLLTSGGLTTPWQIISVDTSVVPPTTPSAGASITTTGANALNLGQTGGGASPVVAYIYGINFNAGTGSSAANLVVGAAQFGGGPAKITLDNCALNLKTTSASSQIFFGENAGTRPDCFANNCTWSFGAAGQSISGAGRVVGGTVAATGTVPTTLFAMSNTNTSNLWVWRDVDLSAITGNLASAVNAVGHVYLENCKLGSGVTMLGGATTGASGGYLHVHNSDSAGTNYRYFYADVFAGSVQQETTIVRTGGATDSTTPISWNITTTANPSYNFPFVSEEMAIWNDVTGSSVTITSYLTTNATLDNSKFWIEVEYLGSASFPLASITSSRSALLASGTTLTTDSSTWGGGALTNKYSVALTFTPQQKGLIKLRLYTAVASSTIYVDPQIVDGTTIAKSFFVPGWGYMNSVNTSSAGLARVFTGM